MNVADKKRLLKSYGSIKIRVKEVENAPAFAEEVKKLKSKLRKIETAISALEDIKQRRVLSFRYLDGMSYTDISERMHYSLERIYQLHREAIKNLKF